METKERPARDELANIAIFDRLLVRDRTAIAKRRWRTHQRLVSKLHRIWKRTKPMHHDPHIATILTHVNATKGIVQRAPTDSESASYYRHQVLDNLIRYEEEHLCSLAAGRLNTEAQSRLAVFRQWRAAA